MRTYGGPFMGSAGGGAGCLCVNPPYHYPGCWKRCGGNVVYYLGSQRGGGVQDSGSAAGQGGPDIEGLLSSLRGLLEGQNVAVHIVIQGGEPLSQCVMRDHHRACDCPRQRVYHETTGGFGGSSGGG